MLDACRNAVLLHAFDVGDHEHGSEIGVFSHVFKVTAVERSAVDVDTGAEHHVFFAIQGFFAERVAIGE